MKFISIQPAIDYFIWQLEVFDYQFQKMGYDLNDSLVMLLHTGKLSDNVIRYAAKNKHRIIFEKDDRTDKSYIPSIKLYGIHKLYYNHKYRVKGHRVFLHDSDIVFTKYFDYDSICLDNNIVYCSDTVSYIGANYLDSKSPVLTNKMCDIVGINPVIVRANQLNSGGAQLIFPNKNIDANIFKKSEIDSNALYKYCNSTEGKSLKKPTDPYPVQNWTAEMWSILWNLWLGGFETEVHNSMEFGWSGWRPERWNEINILHYAGVTSNNEGKFYKAMYRDKMPFGQDLSYVKDNNMTIKIVEIIKELDYLKDYYRY